MASAIGRQLIYSLYTNTPSNSITLRHSLTGSFTGQKNVNNRVSINLAKYSKLIIIPKAIQGNSNKENDDDQNGISLGTMKLPPNTDFAIFETLLFQWANSLCQGANLPLPLPLKVDKIAGGARLGFITISDGGATEVLTYIDCIVILETIDGLEIPIFRAIRKGTLKDKSPPGEPRIMRSLQGALLKSVELARV
ncbi:uncharacterized protein LOC124942122 [Impatiens glandulifera]|uniref:uncharacterized protein LOC124942122 n=1 Tax=Impatiens glandulifera TaxID=253017 RepID=UPI001FB14EA6|nr:uncharacterized protein LOC124942122 [Impatiens glandulifera]